MSRISALTWCLGALVFNSLMGFAPLYPSYDSVWQAVSAIAYNFFRCAPVAYRHLGDPIEQRIDLGNLRRFLNASLSVV
jgi:acyl-coenzyme A synthetase/AMP-(fatty) acid ligase